MTCYRVSEEYGDVMRTERVLFVVDTHTGGEPTRIVLGEFPPVNCDSMIERLEYIKENLD